MKVKKGMLVVLSAPSGGGKTSIYKELLKRNPRFHYSVSATTRHRREGETDGVSYFFMTEDEFEKKIEMNMFAEWAKVYGNYYGTLRTYVDKALSEGHVLLMDLDVQGAKNLSDSYDEAITIFLVPPSLEVLKERLIGRGTDDEENCNRRLKQALKEIAEWSNYRYVVINDEFKRTVETVEAIITAESVKADRFKNDYFDSYSIET